MSYKAVTTKEFHSFNINYLSTLLTKGELSFNTISAHNDHKKSRAALQVQQLRHFSFAYGNARNKK